MREILQVPLLGHGGKPAALLSSAAANDPRTASPYSGLDTDLMLDIVVQQVEDNSTLARNRPGGDVTPSGLLKSAPEKRLLGPTPPPAYAYSTSDHLDREPVACLDALELLVQAEPSGETAGLAGRASAGWHAMAGRRGVRAPPRPPVFTFQELLEL